jgi:hypothetical protein
MALKYTQADIDNLFDNLVTNYFSGSENAHIYKIFVKLNLKPLPEWEKDVDVHQEKYLTKMCKKYDFTIAEEDNDYCIRSIFEDWWSLHIDSCFSPDDYNLSTEFMYDFCKKIVEKHK